MAEIEKTGKRPAQTKRPTKGEVTPKPAAKTFTEEEVKALLAAAVSEAVEKVKNEEKIQKEQAAEAVTVMFIAEVSPENMLVIPGYGSMRPTSTLDIPKQEFKGKFMTPLVRKLIDKRHLLVLDGLTKDERARFNCDYKEGEVMTEKVFDHILEFENEKLISIFKALCDEHKRFVCRKIITAYENGSSFINIEKMRAINNLTKDITPNGLLKPIIDDYGKRLA